MLDQETIDEARPSLVVQKEETLEAIVLRVPVPHFFIAHYESSTPRSSTKPGPTGHAPWLDFVLRLSKAPVSASPKSGSAWSQNKLSWPDIRFPGKKRLFRPAGGWRGVIPGGGALEWLPRMSAIQGA